MIPRFSRYPLPSRRRLFSSATPPPPCALFRRSPSRTRLLISPLRTSHYRDKAILAKILNCSDPTPESRVTKICSIIKLFRKLTIKLFKPARILNDGIEISDDYLRSEESSPDTDLQLNGKITPFSEKPYRYEAADRISSSDSFSGERDE